MTSIINKTLNRLRSPSERLAATLRPDPDYRVRRMESLPKERRERFQRVVERFAPRGGV